jgi:hypothetical protein
MDSLEYSPEGYLIDPEELSFIYTNKALYTLDEVFNNGDVCTILLGETGVGKSIELKRLSQELKDKHYSIQYYNFEVYSDVDKFLDEDSYRNNQFNKDWPTLILIDSIEEIFGEENEYFRKVLKILNNKLKESINSEFKIMLTCRTSYWDDFIENQLGHMLEGVQSSTYYLGPLTQGNVETILHMNMSNVEVSCLLDRIKKYRLQSFARIPIMLNLLIETSKDEYDEYDLSRERIYKVGCAKLCRELNKHRKGYSRQERNTDRKIEIAQWLAYMTVLSEKKTIWIEEDFIKKKHSLYLYEELENEKYTGNEIVQVLNSNLFIKVGVNGYRWAHMSYAEYLCACFLVRHLEEKQIENLIFHKVATERVVPKLREVAAWLIGLNDYSILVNKMIRNDLSTVFLSDLSKYSTEIKKDFILQNIIVCGEGEFRKIRYLDKHIYRTCEFKGLRILITEKLDFLDCFYDNSGNKEIANQVIDKVYETDRYAYNRSLLISEDMTSVLLEIGMLCGYREIIDRSLKYALSYYNIGEYIFNSYLSIADKREIDKLFNTIANKKYEEEYSVRVIRGGFVLNLIYAWGEEKECSQILDIIRDYYSEICKDVLDNRLLHSLDSVVGRMSFEDLYKWINSNVNRTDHSFVKRVLNLMLVQINIAPFDQAIKVMGLILTLGIEFEYSASFEEWFMNNCNDLSNIFNEDEIKKLNHRITIGKPDSSSMSSEALPNVNKADFKDNIIIEQCQLIIAGEIEVWEQLIESLLYKINSNKLYLKVFLYGTEGRGILEKIYWKKVDHKDLILEAAKSYFCKYSSENISHLSHNCGLEHNILLHVLLTEESLFFLNVSEAILVNWISDIIQLEPYNELLIEVLMKKVPHKVIEVIKSNVVDQLNSYRHDRNFHKVLKKVWSEEIAELLWGCFLESQIGPNKKKGIFEFLYQVEKLDAIRISELIFERGYESDIELKLIMLNTYFVNGNTKAFEYFLSLSDTIKGFTVKFVKYLNREHSYFEFLNSFSKQEICELFSRLKSNEQKFIEDYIEERNSEKIFEINEKMAFISAEHDLEKIKEKILYRLVSKDESDSLAYLYELSVRFQGDRVVKELWDSHAEEYLEKSWSGMRVQELRQLVLGPVEVHEPSSNLFEHVVDSCVKLQGVWNHRKLSENDWNTYIVQLLSQAGYAVRDQTLWGKSNAGKGPGEIDIMIVNKRGAPISIIEALSMNSLKKDYLALHLNKVFGYDLNGLKTNFIIVYAKSKNFSEFWNKYLTYISKHNYPFENIETTSIDDKKYANLRVALTKHNRNDMEVYLYHIVVDLYDE